MGRHKKKNKGKKRVVTLPGSYMTTCAIPGPNYFIKVQLYNVKKKNNCQNPKDKKSKNVTHPAMLKANKVYLK